MSPTAPGSKSLSSAAWAYFESLPGFDERIAEAERDLKAGKGVPFREVKRRR